jgi:hypothetical protein
MRKSVIWTGAVAGAMLGAGGWIFEFALSKAAAFVYAVIVSLIANVVFDYVHAPIRPPYGTAAAARIGAIGKEAARAPIRPEAEAALPRRPRPALPRIISPVPLRSLAPPAPLPADTQAGARPAPVAPQPVPPPAPPGPASTTTAAAAQPAAPPAPGPGSGGLY